MYIVRIIYIIHESFTTSTSSASFTSHTSFTSNSYTSPIRLFLIVSRASTSYVQVRVYTCRDHLLTLFYMCTYHVFVAKCARRPNVSDHSPPNTSFSTFAHTSYERVPKSFPNNWVRDILLHVWKVYPTELPALRNRRVLDASSFALVHFRDKTNYFCVMGGGGACSDEMNILMCTERVYWNARREKSKWKPWYEINEDVSNFKCNVLNAMDKSNVQKVCLFFSVSKRQMEYMSQRHRWPQPNVTNLHIFDFRTLRTPPVHLNHCASQHRTDKN